MASNVVFHNEVKSSSQDLEFGCNSILFHGESVDDRGRSVLTMENKNIETKIKLLYDYEKLLVKINDEEVNADKCADLLAKYVKDKNIILEATTLGFAELFLIVHSLLQLDIKSFAITYVEPRAYTRKKSNADEFALSEINSGYKPIPNGIVDLAGEDVEAGVFFLGFEANRLDSALEEHQMIASKEIKLVFGVPAFQPGWELNSIVPHLQYIKTTYSVAYCAANDPGSAYECLEETLESIHPENKMFVAPIGTKPCSIATAIFASIHSGRVGLLYDHRLKKLKRSNDTSVWHKYSVSIN